MFQVSALFPHFVTEFGVDYKIPPSKAGDDPVKSKAQTPISNRGFDAQFLCTVPHHNPLILDGIVASIDSIRLKFTYSKTGFDFDARERFDTINRLLCRLTSDQLWMMGHFDIEVGPERGFKIGNYMRTITYKLRDGSSFAVLVGRYCYDSTVKQIAPEAIMDFNPNKVTLDFWQTIARILSSDAHGISVQRFDLAIDLPIPRNDLQLLQRPGSGYQCFVDPNGAKTEYTGERSHHGAIKLYDKGADLGLPDLICTRCEMTIDGSKYKGIKAHWPTILSHSPLDLTLDLADLPFEVRAVILHPDLHDILKASVNRNTWTKYKKLIQSYGQTYFTLTDDQIAQIDKYVRGYLARIKSLK